MFILYDMMIILTSLLLTLCGDNHTGRGPDSDRGRESDGGGGGPGAGGPRRPSDLAPQTVLGSDIWAWKIIQGVTSGRGLGRVDLDL